MYTYMGVFIDLENCEKSGEKSGKSHIISWEFAGPWCSGWLKLPAGKVGDCGFEPHSDLHLSKK